MDNKTPINSYNEDGCHSTQLQPSFRFFQYLPPEIRIRIWNLALPVSSVVVFNGKEPDRLEAVDIGQVSEEARYEVVRRYKHFVSSMHPCHRSIIQFPLRIDAKNDIFFTKNFCLPKYETQVLSSTKKSLVNRVPFQKIVSNSSVRHLYFDRDHSPHPHEFWLQLYNCPDIVEYTSIWHTVSSQFYIRDYHHPNVYSSETQPSGSEWNWSGSYQNQPLRPGPVISNDTGKFWPDVTDSYAEDMESPRYPAVQFLAEDERTEWLNTFGIADTLRPLEEFVPNVGWIGYHVGPTSVGGNWAGFRYFTDTRRLEFTALAWCEVEPYFKLNKKYGNTGFPDAVYKVWVIRPEQKAATPNQWWHN